jgi:DNA-binding transcriptional LysR family regulator
VRPHQLEVFCAVYEQRSVSGAGRVLRLGQPAVSMQVRELERELGLALFERAGRQLWPTEAGTALYGHARRIRAAFAEAERAMADHREGRQGSVRLGASTTGVVYYLPLLLQGFRRRHPDVRVTVEADLTERVREAVVEGRLDAGLIWGPCRDERLSAEHLLDADFTLIFPPGHPLLERPHLRAPDLRDEPFVLPGDEASPTRRYVLACLHEAGLTPHVSMSLRSTEEVKQAVAAGLGVSAVAARAVRFEVAGGGLVARSVAGIVFAPRPVELILARGPAAPATQNLAAHVRAHAASPAP